jgi:hypothetical protein
MQKSWRKGHLAKVIDNRKRSANDPADRKQSGRLRRTVTLISYYKLLSQYLVLRKDGKTYIITNPIFIEDEPSFLAKEKVDNFRDKPAFKYTYENSMPTEKSVQDKSIQDGSTVEKGAEKGVRRDVEGEVEGEEERDIGETRSHDLVKPIVEPAPMKRLP